MLSTTYKTNGTKSLESALVQLGRQAGFKALTGALRDAAKPIIKAAKTAAPTKTGALKKGIRAQVFRGTGKTDSVATMHIGFHRKTAWYGQILERGAKEHTIKPIPKHKKKALYFGDRFVSSLEHPGTKAYPMLVKSFNSNHQAAVKILKNRLRERIILEAIRKYGKSAR